MVPLNLEKVDKNIKTVLSRIRNDIQTDKFLKRKRSYLLVEGETDKVFIERLTDPERVKCLSMGILSREQDELRTQKQYGNSKEEIINIIYGIAKLHMLLSDCPKDIDEWPLFGLVDRDFDEPMEYAGIDKLFFTDTHDLETLIINTDEEALYKIGSCSISEEDVKKALCLSYQLALSRLSLRGPEGYVHYINNKDGTVDYQNFTVENTINFYSLLQFINGRLTDKLTDSELK